MDDYVCIELPWAWGLVDTSASGALRYLVGTLLDLQVPATVAEKKHEEYSHTPLFIGTTTTLSTVHADRILRLYCKASTRAKVHRLTEQYLQPDASMVWGQAASLYSQCQWVLLHGRIGRSALTTLKDCQYHMSESDDGALITEAIHDGLQLIRFLLSGHLHAIEYWLDSKLAKRPVIILTNAMWNKEPGPHGFGQMPWLVSVPNSTDNDDLYHASGEADPELLSWSNDQKPKRSFAVFLEVVALAVP